MLMATPVPSVTYVQGSPRRSSDLSAMSSWMSAALWKYSMAAAVESAAAGSPPTASQPRRASAGRVRLPPEAVKRSSGW